MDINTLISNIVDSIATDSALSSWANSTYGKDHSVLVSFDKRNPPGEAEAPFIVIHPIQKQVGQGLSDKSHVIEIDCCIYDETTETFAQSNISGYAGVNRIEAFRKLVESAIVRTNVGNALFQTLDIEFDVIESFPFHWAGMAVDIKERVTISSDPLE